MIIIDMDKKTRPIYMLPPKHPCQIKRYTQTKSKGMEKDISWKWKRKKKAGIAVLISNKMDFKTKAIVRDKEGLYIMIKGTVQQNDIIPVNIYVPNIGAPKHLKQIWMDRKREINRNTVIVGYFNTPLTSVDRSSWQKIIKETAALNDTLDQMDLIAIFRPFHTKAEEYIDFPSVYGMFSRLDHILGHKTSVNKFNKTEVISSIFSDYSLWY